jgi:hypothetical protein
MPGAGDHHFRRLDDRQCVVTSPQFERSHGVGRDDGRQRLIADTHSDLREQTIDTDFVDEPVQTITRAQAGERFVRLRNSLATAAFRLLPREQTLDLVL